MGGYLEVTLSSLRVPIVLSRKGMLKMVLKGRMLGERGKGRKRIGFLDIMKEIRLYRELKREVHERRGDCRNTS